MKNYGWKQTSQWDVIDANVYRRYKKINTGLSKLFYSHAFRCND